MTNPNVPNQKVGLLKLPPMHSPVTGFVSEQAVIMSNVSELGPIRPNH